jgi:cell division protease FtsH
MLQQIYSIFTLWISINSIIAYNDKFFPRFNFQSNHLDKKNLEKIEKMFYLRNSVYNPHRSSIFLKYNVNSTNNNNINNSNNQYNITEIIETINNEMMKNYEEQKQFEDELEKMYKNDEDNEENEDTPKDIFVRFPNLKTGSSDPRKKTNEDGYFDQVGVFRYKHKNARTSISDSFEVPTKQNLRRTPYDHDHDNDDDNNNSETSGDGNFQLIKKSPYSFNDVGGYTKIKSELMQTADILINYDKYKKYNVRTPKGIIFEGPPGNGKTLIAKGFSGELNVSFIPVSGSEFSEKYVGVGASRVRELFKLAEKNKPCIIFIDEIDAVARKRGNDEVSSNSEKDQTLNQLLISLDGFKSSNGIFVIGATNRVDLLDPAIIRPGRMDKNIFIGNPDSETRREILTIHLKGKPIEPIVSVDYLVEMTGGFSGAQIENLINESMLRALRENREVISMEDLEFIINRMVAGWQSTENKYSDDIIQRILIHEMGHAIVGFFSHEHSKLAKVCINLWSPKTPGYTIFENNDEDNNIYTKNGLFSHLMVLLGGRIAEEVFYGYSVTTGARKDLEEAYKLTQNMILQYGMGKQSIYPDLSERSKFLIDQEINHLLLLAHTEATSIILNSKDMIVDCCETLKKDNILKPEQIVEIINKKYPDLWKLYDVRDLYSM